MAVMIDPEGTWYHGSNLELDTLRKGSTITQWRGLAEAFSHKPTGLGYDEYGDDGGIIHNGTEDGYLFVIDEPLSMDADIYRHPRTTMDPGAEWLTRRELKLRLTAILRGDCRIRLAEPGDAGALCRLNEQFNGPGDVTPESVAASLIGNFQEAVAVAEADGEPVGFACVQRKLSFCYGRAAAEITEAFVREEFRRRGLASGMLELLKKHCRRCWHVETLSLLTGGDNFGAQELYRRSGYRREDEALFVKELE